MRLLKKSSADRSKGRRRVSETNSRRPASFEYYSQRPTERSEQREQRPKAPRESWLGKLGFYVLATAVLASIFSALTLSPHAKVLPLNSGSNNLYIHDQATYQAAADTLLSKSIWNHSKLTIQTKTISKQLQSEFPELSSVTVSLPLLAHRPNIYVETGQPAAILVTAHGRYLLDSTGKALLKDAQTDSYSELHLPQIDDQSGLRVQLGKQALTSQNISFVQTVVKQLAARQTTISSMAFPAGSSELDVHIASQPYYVKFNLQSDTARLQAGTFLATAAQLQRQHSTPTKYIDVRVPGRAYYQ